MKTILRVNLLIGFILIFSICNSDANWNRFSIYVAVGAKIDLRLIDKIVPITHILNPPLSPSGTIYVPEVSGMKYTSVISPIFEVNSICKIKKNFPLDMRFSIASVKREQLLKEYLIDDLNEFNRINYSYNFLNVGIGLEFKKAEWSVGAFLIRQIFLNSEVEYTLKNHPSFKTTGSDSHYYLTPNYMLKINLCYSFSFGKLNPLLEVFMEPYFNDCKSISLGLKLNIKII